MSEIEKGEFEFETTSAPYIRNDEDGMCDVSCHAVKDYWYSVDLKKFKVKIQYEEIKECDELMLARARSAYIDKCKNINGWAKTYKKGIVPDVDKHELLLAELEYVCRCIRYGENNKENRDRAKMLLDILKGVNAIRDYENQKEKIKQ